MNIIKKNALYYIYGILVSIMLGQCKSPKPPQADREIPKVDTLTTMDTAKSADKSIEKVVSHIPLTLIIRNLNSTNSPVIVGLYGTKNKFPDPNDQFKEYHFPSSGKELIAKIQDVEFGQYAIAIYQDVNSNGKIDKNVIGIPTEPYAFSNNYRPRVKAPGFDNCKFDYDSINNTITMNMIK